MVASIDYPECQLQQLALEAQKYSPRHPQRQSALTQLVNLIQSSNQLGHPQCPSFLSHAYEDIYNEALQRTLLHVCQKIENYRPKHPVMAWVNYLLNYHVKAVINEYYHQGVTYIPTNRNDRDRSVVLSVDSLEEFLLESDRSNDSYQEEALLLRKFLEEDPENFLGTTHIRGRPDITFQRLAWRKYVEDRSWGDLSQEFGISTQTLCSFFNRNLRKFKLYFDRHLQF